MSKYPSGIPRGASFDLLTGRWYIAQPTEPRPFFDALIRMGAGNFVTHVTGKNDAYITISPPGGPGVPVKGERLTHAEYQMLQPNAAPAPYDPDVIVTGFGPMIGLSFVSEPEVKLKGDEAGLIIAPGITRQDDGSLRPGPGLDLAELRSALLLWDYLDWPSSSLYPEPTNAETDFLAQEGILLRTGFQAMGAMHVAGDILSLAKQTFEAAEEREPGRWAVGQGQSADQDSDTIAGRSLLIKLSEIVTVPAAEVPLEDILEFRLKRRPELLKLRAHINELYQKISAAPDRAASLVKEAGGLARAIEDQRRVADEALWRKVVGSLGSVVKLDNLGTAGAAAWASFAGTGSMTAAAAVGAGALGVKVTVNATTRAGGSDDLKYVIEMDKAFKPRS